MITKSTLGTMAKDQLKEFESLDGTIRRSRLSKLAAYGGSAALVIKGLRRCGKSTLLKQIVKLKFQDDFYYFNFDDERLTGFNAQEFQTLMEVLIEEFGTKRYAFFDEIQNIDGWELFVNRILRDGYHVFITGSNANLLSKELGTHLTGRHIDIELYPFSFDEFLDAKGVKVQNGAHSTEEKARISRNFKEYFNMGGMPEVVTQKNEQVLTQLLNDIIQRDIVSRYNIRKPNELKSVIKFLIANAANEITYRSIRENFDIKSANTVQKYVDATEETYLIFTVKRYDTKIKKLDKNARKVYCIDNGIITKNSPVMNERRGAMLENIIAVHLKRLGKEFYYYRGRSEAEADFVIPSERKAIQVCYEVNEDNRKREMDGLFEAMEHTKATDGVVITFDQEGEIKWEKGRAVLIPAWQWLLEHK
jgi:predicted AAA+ superfamily ATPase